MPVLAARSSFEDVPGPAGLTLPRGKPNNRNPHLAVRRSFQDRPETFPVDFPIFYCITCRRRCKTRSRPGAPTE